MGEPYMNVAVELIAQTVIDEHAMSKWGYDINTKDVEIDWGASEDPDLWPVSTDTYVDELHEMAGRLCYLSFDRPNPKTANNEAYLSNVISQGHTSVIGHASFTFHIVCSRACAHEMIRSRFLAFSEVSQRYVDPRKILSHCGENPDDFMWADYLTDYDMAYHTRIAAGDNRKEARGTARKMLPLSFPTALIVTGNVRAWRDFIAQRDSVYADREIRRVAQLVRAELERHAPHSMQHLPATETSTET